MLCKNTSSVAVVVVFIVMIEFLANEIEVKNRNLPPSSKKENKILWCFWNDILIHINVEFNISYMSDK